MGALGQLVQEAWESSRKNGGMRCLKSGEELSTGRLSCDRGVCGGLSCTL